MTFSQPIPTVTTTSKAEEDIPTYDARDIVAGGVQARLLLDEQAYWLRITRAGKLILTK